MGSRRRPFLTTALSSRLKKIQVEAELRASKKKHPSQVGDFLASFLLLSLLVPLSLSHPFRPRCSYLDIVGI